MGVAEWAGEVWGDSPTGASGSRGRSARRAALARPWTAGRSSTAPNVASLRLASVISLPVEDGGAAHGESGQEVYIDNEQRRVRLLE